MKLFLKILKWFGITILTITGVLLLTVGLLNVLKFAIYSEYYSIREKVCDNPGLNDGFIPQGIATLNDKDIIITSGYMNDKTNSRIYVTDLSNNSYYLKLMKNGSDFKGHCGGISSHNDKVYIASGSKIYVIDLNKILSSSNGDELDVGEGIEVNNSASYIYAGNNYLYVGEFSYAEKGYVTNHEHKTNDGIYYAICSAYSYDDLTTPKIIYSIRDKVQGFVITDNGSIVLSTSFGLNDSYYYVYSKENIRLSETLIDNTTTYVLDNYLKKIKAPAMSEDLSYKNGIVYSLTESACNKYIFGKLFGANYLFSMKID